MSTSDRHRLIDTGTNRRMRKIGAGIVAVSLALGGLFVAYGANCDPKVDPHCSAGDHGELGGDGIGDKATHGEWFIDDNNHAATVDSVRWFISHMNNNTGKLARNAPGAIQEALNQAITRCQARGGTNCRLVGVGVAITNDGWYSAGNIVGSGGLNAYKASLRNFSGKWLSYNGYSYHINSDFRRNDGSQTSLYRLGLESIDAVGGNANINVIVLSQGEPRPPKVIPPAPTKEIERGISADRMNNYTHITTDTGVGADSLIIRDTFNPNGLRYTVTDQSMWDLTTGQNISGSFWWNTQNGQTPAGNVLTATWNGGSKIPDNHRFQLRLAVTVDHPNINHVDDEGSVQWDSTNQYTGWKTFPTWWGTPNKAWVFWNETENRWMSVADRDWTNSVGADNRRDYLFSSAPSVAALSFPYISGINLSWS